MGVRQGSYATIWSVEDKGNWSNVRLSTSRKNKQTGAYEQDFGGFVRFIGDAHKNAGSLKERDRVKFGDVEITNSYNKDKNITYTNVACFNFDLVDSNQSSLEKTAPKSSKKIEEVDEDDPF